METFALNGTATTIWCLLFKLVVHNEVVGWFGSRNVDCTCVPCSKQDPLILHVGLAHTPFAGISQPEEGKFTAPIELHDLLKKICTQADNS